MVRLKAVGGDEKAWVKAYGFNSKMVRLKGAMEEKIKYTYTAFQFQNGAIKS